MLILSSNCKLDRDFCNTDIAEIIDHTKGCNDDRIGMVMTREDKRARDAGRPSAGYKNLPRQVCASLRTIAITGNA
jgi:hypothetical protein